MGRKQLEYLEDERKKLWEAVAEFLEFEKTTIATLQDLKEAVEKKASDYEAEAKAASIDATRCRDEAKTSLEAIQSLQTQASHIATDAEKAKELLGQIESDAGTIKNHAASGAEAATALNSVKQQVDATFQSSKTQFEEIQAQLNEAKEVLTSASTLKTDLTAIRDTSKSQSDEVSTAHSQVSKKSAQINEAHQEVFGYTHKDSETGEAHRTEGTKDELQTAFDDLKHEVTNYSETIQSFRDEKEGEYEKFIEEQRKTLNNLEQKIRGLLPEALTAGLSHAYEQKRRTEENTLERAKRGFRWSIWVLALTSLFIVGGGFYFIWLGKPLVDVIAHLPRLTIAILPLYLPFLWLAMSANKQAKLSKRLIEEYSHKESLSKTFEGLSYQIEALGDSDIADNLRAQLLYNIISMSSENPGKLMKDFHQSDNPIFDLLNKSLSLSQSLERVSAMPGIGRIIKPLAKRFERKLAEQHEDVKARVTEAVACTHDEEPESEEEA